jgi:hypothetical protein
MSADYDRTELSRDNPLTLTTLTTNANGFSQEESVSLTILLAFDDRRLPVIRPAPSLLFVATELDQ